MKHATVLRTAALGSLPVALQQDWKDREVAAASPAREVFVKPSANPNGTHSIFFPRRGGLIPPEAINCGPLGLAAPLFKITSPTTDYYSLRLSLLRAGFQRVPCPKMSVPCNVVWGKSMPMKQLFTVARGEGQPVADDTATIGDEAQSQRQQQLDERSAYVRSMMLVNPWQKFNHFPGGHFNLGCKRGLARNLARMQKRLPKLYDFAPLTIRYPEDRDALVDVMRNSHRGSKFIWKPARGSCGRGITISDGGKDAEPSWKRVMALVDAKAAEVPETPSTPNIFKHYVVQQYVDNPLLISGRKFDLRLYVCVTRYSPHLVVYLHEEGLVRFAARAYSTEEREAHLTNYSIGRRLETPATATDPAKLLDLKWSLEKLKRHLVTGEGLNPLGPRIDPDAMWRDVRRIIVSTLLAAQPNIVKASQQTAELLPDSTALSVTQSSRYFELYGFDIMFDETGKAWLIEVNTLPSLESSSTLDYEVKSNITTDILNMAGVELFDRKPIDFVSNGLILPENLAIGATAQTFVHSPCKPLAAVADDRAAALHYQLLDELKYSGGFQRLHPCEDDPELASKYTQIASEL